MLEPLCHPLQRVTGVAIGSEGDHVLWGEATRYVYCARQKTRTAETKVPQGAEACRADK